MKGNPRDLERARAQWSHRGSTRPAWAIEPRPGEESVCDHPGPPRLDADRRLVRVVHGAITIAESRRAIRVLETASPPTFYIPRSDVRIESLVRGRGASHCEWKGNATYWSLRTEASEIPNIGWSYERPYPEFMAIQGYSSFYPAKVECYVGTERVQRQPGGSCGGWVTSELVGPFKSEAGTGSW